MYEGDAVPLNKLVWLRTALVGLGGGILVWNMTGNLSIWFARCLVCVVAVAAFVCYKLFMSRLGSRYLMVEESPGSLGQGAR